MKKSDIERLEDWMREIQVFPTHSVQEWGLKNYSGRADRNKRILQAQGKIRKLTALEKKEAGYTCKDGVYEWIFKEEFQFAEML